MLQARADLFNKAKYSSLNIKHVLPREDMIAVYKSLNGDCIIERKPFNLRSLKKTCSHTMKSKEKQFNLKLNTVYTRV